MTPAERASSSPRAVDREHAVDLGVLAAAIGRYRANERRPLEQIQADILLAHLDPMQGGFGHAKLPCEVPVGSVPTSPSSFAC